VTRFAGHLHCETKQLKQLMASEWFAGLHQIQATSLNANAAVFAKALSSLPNLHTFEAKGFNPQTIPTDLIAALPKAGKLSALSRLRLRDIPLGKQGCAALAKAMMPQLRELELIECGVNDAGIIAMAGSPVFDQLTFFSVARSMRREGALSGSCFWDGEYPSLGVVSHPNPTCAGLTTIATRFPQT